MGARGIHQPIAPEAEGAGTRYVSIITDEVELVELSRPRTAQSRGWLLAVGVLVVAAAMVVGLVEVGVVSVGPRPDKSVSIAALLTSPTPSTAEASLPATPGIMVQPVPATPLEASPSPASQSPASSSPTSRTAPTPTPAPVIVVVAAGDSLSGIAARYGVTLADVLAANPQLIDPSLLHVGDRIAVPRAIVNQLVGGTHDPVPAWTAGTRQACSVYGWAFDPNDRTTDVTVRILVDGRVRVSVVAYEYRQDLAQFAIGGDGTAAFSVDMSKLLAPDVAHRIRVQAQDLQSREWVDLNGTPRELTCTTVES